jgi:hypothetical protein
MKHCIIYVLFSKKCHLFHTLIFSVKIMFFINHAKNIYRVSQEEGTKLREGVPYVKLYRKTPKHPYPKLNGLGDNGN